MAKLNILCISRFFKGEDFIRYAKKEGHNVYLLTSKNLESKQWPWESIDDTFYMIENDEGEWNKDHLIAGLAHKMKLIRFDILVALDDFDVEHVAFLREYFRIPGMGETTARYFRDKLAMRFKAQLENIPIPAFSSLFYDEDIHKFTQEVPAPWLVKPRMQASAAGIEKIYNAEELWKHLEYLGNERHEYLIEKFTPGTVFHVDSLTYNSEVIFTRTSQYIDTPFEVAHGGGIFRSLTNIIGSEVDLGLQAINDQVLKGFGMNYSASHSEYIQSHEDGKFYFLETSSRVGGANISEMVEFASGINLWGEWARIEIATKLGLKYKLPKVRKDYAGVIVSLSKFQHPDSSSFEDKEVVWRMNKEYHIGMIVASKNRNNLVELLDKYAERIKNEFHTSAPAKKKLIGE